jgi:hypothetical protein
MHLKNVLEVLDEIKQVEGSVWFPAKAKIAKMELDAETEGGTTGCEASSDMSIYDRQEVAIRNLYGLPLMEPLDK